MEGAREAIVRVLGEENAAEIRPKYIKKRVLFLESTHPAISAEVKRVEQNIIAAVNNKLGRPEVVSIQFVLPYR